MTPSESAETCAADIRVGLCQGDILKFGPDDSGADGADYGVIINADCDLENKKTEGIISYLPTYTLHTYLSRFWAPKHIAALLADSLSKLSDACELKPQETSELRDWIEADGESAVTATLLGKMLLKRANQAKVSTNIHRAAVCLSDRKPLEKLALLSLSDSDPKAYLTKQLSAGRSAIGDAGFFVSEIVGDRRLGFVIRLCRVLSLPEEVCFKSESDRLSKGTDQHAGHRTARLSPTYKFRVAQVFANQFSRIGLPNELMALDRIALHDLAETLITEMSQ